MLSVQQRCYCGSSQCRQVVGGRSQKTEVKSDHLLSQPDPHQLVSKVVIIIEKYRAVSHDYPLLHTLITAEIIKVILLNITLTCQSVPIIAFMIFAVLNVYNTYVQTRPTCQKDPYDHRTQDQGQELVTVIKSKTNKSSRQQHRHIILSMHRHQ